MNLSDGAVRDSVARSWGRFLAELQAAGDTAWSDPTRLSGWAVADLAAHAVWGASMEADALRRWRTGASGRAEGRTMEPSAGREALTTAFDQAQRALVDELAQVGDGDRTRSVPMPYADLPLDTVLPILVMEAGVHTNDLLAALGRDEPLPDEVTAASVSFLETFVPFLAGQATEVPADPTEIALSSPGTDLRFSFSGGTWSLAPRDRPGEPDFAVRAPDGSTLMLYALGRLDPDDPRLGSTDAARLIKRWIPGP